MGRLRISGGVGRERTPRSLIAHKTPKDLEFSKIVDCLVVIKCNDSN